MIDFPLASAIHSGCTKIFVLTQFLSTTLHRHLQATYKHVEILPCEQKPEHREWYQGTADAIRHHLNYICEAPADYYLILAGDQLYQMDFTKLLDYAKAKRSDLTVAALHVEAKLTGRMGTLVTDTEGRITTFREKEAQNGPGPYLGSMGIYLFTRQTLIDSLSTMKGHDFGHDLIPHLIKTTRAYAYIYDDYWEDIGTLDSFYAANLRFLEPTPPLDLHVSALFSPAIPLPAPKIFKTEIEKSILGEGSSIAAKQISQSIIGPKTTIGSGSTISASYLMGSTTIGKQCRIHRAIVDEHVTLSDHVELTNAAERTHYDGPGPLIREGLIIVPRGTQLPTNFKL